MRSHDVKPVRVNDINSSELISLGGTLTAKPDWEEQRTLIATNCCFGLRV